MKPMIWIYIFSLALLIGASAAAQQQPVDDDEDDPFELTLRADLGVVTPLYHRIQYSEEGTDFDYVGDGGQNVLFTFNRLATDVRLGSRHHLTFVFQPLRLETSVRLAQDVTVDDAVFEEGQPVDLLYNFPYYRTTYLYDLRQSEDAEFSIGGGLQIRNATIVFRRADGELQRDRRDLGLVPLLKLRTRRSLGDDWFFGGELAGFYAPIRYLNISDSDVEGAIADGNLLIGRTLDEHTRAYLTLRYVGGGAQGTSEQPADEPGDGFTRNWIHALSLAVGFEYTF